MENIYNIAKKIHIDDEFIIPYGLDKAKISLKINDTLTNKADGKLVLVTAITPTKAGEGKTTTSIALLDGLMSINKQALLCLREPSLGPVFGIKGGATGGGKASIIPSEDINLHFTGDMHALTSAINLISAIIDNHIFQGNELKIDPNRILWKRALDMNDRALRSVTVNENEKKSQPRHEEFVITVASELMAIFCLASDEQDFINRVNNILVAFTFDGEPIYLKQLSISGAIFKLMKNALSPNLVQTLEGNPVLVHGGPFANIAHGCNSLIATKMALKLSPVVITEAGFGADLGAEKFFDIKCRTGNLKPNLVVMVATIRALKMHGGVSLDDLHIENVDALKEGFKNLKQHMENINKFNVPAIICINHFDSDTQNETEALKKWCLENNFKYAFCSSFNDGSNGGKELAELVAKTLDETTSNFKPLYDLNDDIEDNIEKIAREIYRADGVIYTPEAKEQLELFKSLGYKHLPICIAKTPLSFTDNGKILNAPRNFKITIREFRLSSGANFLVALTGNILTMPGLPKVPSALNMKIE